MTNLTKLVARAIDGGAFYDEDDNPCGFGGTSLSQPSNNARTLATLRAAKRVLTALRDAGYAVVPVEPTEEMVEVGLDDPKITWKAMIAAAPEADNG